MFFLKYNKKLYEGEFIPNVKFAKTNLTPQTSNQETAIESNCLLYIFNISPIIKSNCIFFRLMSTQTSRKNFFLSWSYKHLLFFHVCMLISQKKIYIQ